MRPGPPFWLLRLLGWLKPGRATSHSGGWFLRNKHAGTDPSCSVDYAPAENRDEKYMPNEKTLDYNPAEEKPASGDGQPENNTSESESDIKESDIDDILSQGKDVDDFKIEDDDDETVVVKKSQLKKILDVKKSYKDGLVSFKEKLKKSKNQTQKEQTEKPAQKPEKKEAQKSDDLKEILKGIEQDAIATACEDPFIEENWNGIMAEFDKNTARTSKASILRGITKAVAAFKELNPKAVEEFQKKHEDDEDTEATAELSRNNGIQYRSGKKGAKKPAKKSILGKTTSVGEWYPEKK